VTVVSVDDLMSTGDEAKPPAVAVWRHISLRTAGHRGQSSYA
jgi:hypothetical protein